jgi:single-strand DNA-binding protein
MSVNKVILVGRVGGNPDIRTTQDGRKIATFSVATSDKWKDKSTNELKERVEWHRIVVLSDGLSGIVERYVKKGSRVYVEGMLQTRKWQDQSGAERHSTEVVLQGFNNKLEIIDPKKEDGGSSSSYSSSGKKDSDNDYPEYDNVDDSVPF